MTDEQTRRRALGGLASLFGLVALPARAQEQPPRDRGIGGTGVRPDEEESDRGIGGTGVIGTIRRFGSIVVNDLRITYPRNVAVFLDGAPATVADLKLGHVVRVFARRQGGLLRTNRIDVTSEVVGPIERVGEGSLHVLGQTVSTAQLASIAGFEVGQRVAVAGLRRPDGSIAATLIEARTGPSDILAGPLVRASDGSLAIGGATISGLDSSLLGKRVILTGVASSSGFDAAQAVDEASLLSSRTRRLSIEAYVQRETAGLRLGSGYRAALRPGSRLAPATTSRAIVNVVIGRDGRLSGGAVRVPSDDGASRRQDGFGQSGAGRPGGRAPANNPGGPGAPQGSPPSPGRPPGGAGPAGSPPSSFPSGQFGGGAGQRLSPPGFPPQGMTPPGPGGPGGLGGPGSGGPGGAPPFGGPPGRR